MTTPIPASTCTRPTQTAWVKPLPLLLLMPVTGLLLSLGFPNAVIPGHLGDRPPFFIAWLALILFYWGSYQLSPRLAVLGSWLFALTLYLSLISWMTLFGKLPWVLLALALSCIGPLAAWAANRMALPRWAHPLGFALCWTAIEWLRSQGIFGLSWGEIGMSQIEGFPAAIASLGGIGLISFLMLWPLGTVIICRHDRTMPRWVLPAALGALACACLGGYWQTHAAVTRSLQQQPTQRFVVVQPNLLRDLTPESLVSDVDNAELQRRLMTQITLSGSDLPATRPGESRPIIVWSESSISYPPEFAPEIFSFAHENGSLFLVGAPSFGPRNSAYLIGPDGEEARYDKIHLVPFGEFVPMRRLVTSFYTVRENDLIPGARWTPMMINGQAVGVAICFESTLSSIARTYANAGARYLVYITNDAWFHQTPAVRQHFNHARFRAIETGLPVVRTASTGISGFIAPDGRIIAEIPTYTEKTENQALHPGVPGTINTAGGWLFAPLTAVLSLALLMRGLFLSRRKSVAKRTSF